MTLRIKKKDDRVFEFSYSYKGGPFVVLGSATHPMDGDPGDPEDDPNIDEILPETPGIVIGVHPAFVAKYDNFATGRD